MMNQNVMVIQTFIRQSVEKLSEYYIFKTVGNRWGFEQSLAGDGSASDSDHVMSTQDFTKVEHVKT